MASSCQEGSPRPAPSEPQAHTGNQEEHQRHALLLIGPMLFSNKMVTAAARGPVDS